MVVGFICATGCSPFRAFRFGVRTAPRAPTLAETIPQVATDRPRAIGDQFRLTIRVVERRHIHVNATALGLERELPTRLLELRGDARVTHLDHEGEVDEIALTIEQLTIPEIATFNSYYRPRVEMQVKWRCAAGCTKFSVAGRPMDAEFVGPLGELLAVDESLFWGSRTFGEPQQQRPNSMWNLGIRRVDDDMMVVDGERRVYSRLGWVSDAGVERGARWVELTAQMTQPVIEFDADTDGDFGRIRRSISSIRRAVFSYAAEAPVRRMHDESHIEQIGTRRMDLHGVFYKLIVDWERDVTIDNFVPAPREVAPSDTIPTTNDPDSTG